MTFYERKIKEIIEDNKYEEGKDYTLMQVTTGKYGVFDYYFFFDAKLHQQIMNQIYFSGV